MPGYKYTASDVKGKIVKGNAYASDPSHLKESLMNNSGLYLVSWEEYNRDAVRIRLGRGQLSEFCRELGSLLKAGIPVVKALSIISTRTTDKKLSKLLNAVGAEVRKGSDLSLAMKMQEDSFPGLLVSVIRSGEESGDLDKSCLNMAEYYEREKRLSSEIRSAMLYPVILLCLTLGVIIAVFAFILPSFMNLFEDTKLPLITRIMMKISDIFTKYPLPLILTAGTAVSIVALVGRSERVRLFADKAKLRLPKVGRLNRIICTARFARTLSTLYSSGTSILNAVSLAGSTVENQYISSQFDKTLKMLRSGSSLSSALGAIDGLDQKLLQTIGIGEESSSLDELLENIADDYDYEALATAKRMITLIEPLMIIIMATVVLVVICSVMLPIYDLYSSIDGQEAIGYSVRAIIKG